MALKWKVVSQRNWLKGLQATFSRFSQPQAAFVRLSNLLYDIRGGLRTTDGSQIFTQLQGANNVEGPITEIALYSPTGQPPYYVGIMAKAGTEIDTPAPNPLLFKQVGGNITSIVFSGAPSPTATVNFAAPHNLSTSSNPNGQLIISGNSVASFNQTYTFSQIAVTDATRITIPTSLTAAVTGTGGSMTTSLAAGIAAGNTYSYQVTANDGQGGETPASSVVSGSNGVSAPVVRGSNIISGGSSANSLTVALPTGTQAGDLAIIFANSGYTPSVPSGWTNLSVASQATWSAIAASRILNSGDISAGAVTVNMSGAYNCVLGIVTFVGAPGPVRETESGQNAGNPITITNTTTSAVLNTDMAIYWASARQTGTTGLATITPASGSAHTLQTDTPNTATLLANQNMPGGVLAVANAWTTNAGAGATAAQVIVQGGSSGVVNANAITVSWAPVPGAVGYNVYGRTLTSAIPANVCLIGAVTAWTWNDSPHSGPVAEYIWKNPSDVGSGTPRTTDNAYGKITGSSLMFDVNYSSYPGNGGPGDPVLWTNLDSSGAVIGTQPLFPGGKPESAGFSDFNGCILATLSVPAAGTYTFTLNYKDQIMVGVGGGATVSGGYKTGNFGQTKSVINGNPLVLVGAVNSGGGPQTSVITLTFSSAGSYPLEIDWVYWFHSGRTMTMYLSASTPIPPAAATAFGYGELNQQGNMLAGLIKGTSFDDLGGTPYATQPPSYSTALSQSVEVFHMTGQSFSQVLGVFPTYYAPPLGYIPGANDPPPMDPGIVTAQGGIVGATEPLPQIVQFANKLMFAMGNGFAPQEYLDPNSGGSGNIVPVGNNFNAQYTDWQAGVAWNAGDTIKDSVSGGLFSAQQAGSSGTTRPTFNNTLGATTPETTPGTVVWQCVATSSTGTPLRGAAHEIVYAGSLWFANTWPTTTADQLDGPNCIKMSDVNNPESWNPVNIAFLSKDDGDQITALATFTIAQAGISPTQTLVVFKNFSTFQINGVFGASDFSIQQAQTDMGSVAGRTVQFIPGYGIARLTHLGFAYFQGVSDKLISEEIRPYLFGGPPDIAPIDWNYVYLSKASQAANPPLYVAACPIKVPVLAGVTVSAEGGSKPIFVRVEQLINGTPMAVTAEIQVNYNAVQSITVTTPQASPGVTYRVFTGSVPGGENLYIEQPTFQNQTIPISSMNPGYLAFGNGGLSRLFCYDLVVKQWAVIDIPIQISCLKQIRTPGTIPITVAGGANDGALRRLFSGDQTWDDGSQVQWSFRSSELYQEGGSAKMFFRRLVLRGTNALNSNLVVTVGLQGSDTVMGRGAGRTVLGGPGGATQWELRVDIMRDAENANAQISGSGPVQIQIESLDWHVYPKPSGTPVTIQR